MLSLIITRDLTHSRESNSLGLGATKNHPNSIDLPPLADMHRSGVVFDPQKSAGASTSPSNENILELGDFLASLDLGDTLLLCHKYTHCTSNTTTSR